MKIEAGKRYNRRDGEISGVIKRRKINGDTVYAKHTFMDDKLSYLPNGLWGLMDDRVSINDLISEYIEEPDYSKQDLERHANAAGYESYVFGDTTTPTSDYQRGINAAILWLVGNYADYKPEYLAEHMMEDLSDD